MSNRDFRTTARTACAALIVLAVMAWTANGAPACGCREIRGPVVAKGQSLYGIPWRVKVSAGLVRVPGPSRAIDIQFSIGQDNDLTGVRYFELIRLPVHPGFVFTANYGSEMSDYPESDVSGVTRRRVWTLTVEMSDGESINVQPTLAPPRLLRRFKWLRQVRFYDLFFPASQTPERITALDRQGNVLARYSNRRGVFRP